MTVAENGLEAEIIELVAFPVESMLEVFSALICSARAWFQSPGKLQLEIVLYGINSWSVNEIIQGQNWIP